MVRSVQRLHSGCRVWQRSTAVKVGTIHSFTFTFATLTAKISSAVSLISTPLIVEVKLKVNSGCLSNDCYYITLSPNPTIISLKDWFSATNKPHNQLICYWKILCLLWFNKTLIISSTRLGSLSYKSSFSYKSNSKSFSFRQLILVLKYQTPLNRINASIYIL